MEEWQRARSDRPAAMPPMEPQAAQRTPLAELRVAGQAVRSFRGALGGNPVGANAEIVRALLGANPRGTRFLDPSAVNLSPEGEMLDAWGRPVFFHQISSTLMEIRSAGPDGRMFTADDVVTP